jgi:hypothetical protein
LHFLDTSHKIVAVEASEFPSKPTACYGSRQALELDAVENKLLCSFPSLALLAPATPAEMAPFLSHRP